MSLTAERAGRAFRASTVLLAFALLAGCSNANDTIAVPATTRPPRPPRTTTTLGQDPVAAEIVDRYKRFWEARFEANQAPPNPQLPALREYATGQQLDNVVAETRRNLQEGLALRRPEKPVARSSVKVVRIEGDVAMLQECAVDDGVVYRYGTGDLVNAAVATHSVEATMRKVDGVWKLAAARLVQRWEGVAGCALSADF